MPQNNYENLYKSLFEISQKLVAKTLLPDILNFAYDLLRQEIPFDRLGLAVTDKYMQTLKVIWVKSEYPITNIPKGYSADIKSVGLRQILETGKPRILNNLEEHLTKHPESQSTKQILADGIKSSLSFPLIGSGRAAGIIFFSSMKKNTYDNSHVEAFSKVADHLSLIIEHAQLSDLHNSVNAKDLTMRTTIHDLRSPLGIIKSYLDLIKDDILVGQKNSFILEAFKGLESSSDQMMMLLEDLMDVYSLNNGPNFRPKLTLIKELIKDTVSSFFEIARKKEVNIELVLDNSLPAYLCIEASQMRRAFGNLIENAIKYTAIHSTVKICVKPCDQDIEFSVVDQGRGIPQTEMKNLFSEYGRTSVVPTAGEPSTGLGLYISRLIVEAHHGKILAESIEGQGSKFTIRLPNSFLTKSLTDESTQIAD